MADDITTDCFTDEHKTLHIHDLRHLTARAKDMDPTARVARESDNLSKVLAYYKGKDCLTARSCSKGTIIYHGALLTRKQRPILSSRESERVVLKMGFGDDAVQRLLREHGFYQRLLPLQGDRVPLCHGLYQGHMGAFAGARSTTVACLLLEHCGDMCDDLHEMPWKFRLVPKVSTNPHYL